MSTQIHGHVDEVEQATVAGRDEMLHQLRLRQVLRKIAHHQCHLRFKNSVSSYATVVPMYMHCITTAFLLLYFCGLRACAEHRQWRAEVGRRRQWSRQWWWEQVAIHKAQGACEGETAAMITTVIVICRERGQRC